MPSDWEAHPDKARSMHADRSALLGHDYLDWKDLTT
jgi:hypothetical protein